MNARTLITAVVLALSLVLCLAVPALAQDPATAPECVAADGQVVPAPAGTSAGAPAPCPAGSPAPPAPSTGETPAAPQPPATPETPAAQPEVPAGEPTTEAPADGTQEAQDIERDALKSKPKVERKKKAKSRKKRSSKDPSTGPDDRTPGAPPASLLEDPAPVGNAPAGPAGASEPLYVTAPPAITRGVPNILLDRFRIPPFLLPIYQAAGVEYGVRWEILAAINSIETDYGRNLSVSTAGAMGWMQFMPGTWKSYGVDANRDGKKDPYNPVDAIFAAARYLKAAGAGESLRAAIWAYNHADWYVNDVLERARSLGAIPPEVIGSLSGLTLGRFPVADQATYAGRLSAKAARSRVSGANASIPVEDDATRRGMRIYAEAGAPVVAVQDARVVSIGTTERLGRYIRLRDAYGNTYTYAHLATVADKHPVPKARRQSERDVRRELGLDGRDPKPKKAASAGRRVRAAAPAPEIALPEATPAPSPPVASQLSDGRVRSFVLQAASRPAAGEALPPGVAAFRAYFAEPYGLKSDDVVLHPLRKGSRVIGGTVLGRIGARSLAFDDGVSAADRRAARATAERAGAERAPHVYLEIRPAGKGAPRIDPKPILDGWRLLDSTAIYRARNPLVRGDGKVSKASIGQIMLMSKQQLIERVLRNPDIEIYACGRRDIRAGIVDRRVLATLEFLVAKNMKPTVTSLRCGHGYLTSSGNVSHHSFGTAVDVAAINGVPIIGHQGAGSITDKAVRALLTLQGTMKPAQIITLMQYKGTDNTFAMGDHDDHIHIGWDPAESEATSALKPKQWDRLVGGLAKIRNPIVPVQPSRFALAVTKKPSASRGGHGHDHGG